MDLIHQRFNGATVTHGESEMTEVSKEAVEALVKALISVDETIKLDLIDATAVAFELKKQGFTISRAEPVGFEAAIKQLGEPDVATGHWSLDEGNLRWFVRQCARKPSMTDASEADSMLIKVLNFIERCRDLRIITGGSDADNKTAEREDLRTSADAIYKELEAVKWGVRVGPAMSEAELEREAR